MAITVKIDKDNKSVLLVKDSQGKYTAKAVTQQETENNTYSASPVGLTASSQLINQLSEQVVTVNDSSFQNLTYTDNVGTIYDSTLVTPPVNPTTLKAEFDLDKIDQLQEFIGTKDEVINIDTSTCTKYYSQYPINGKGCTFADLVEHITWKYGNINNILSAPITYTSVTGVNTIIQIKDVEIKHKEALNSCTGYYLVNGINAYNELITQQGIRQDNINQNIDYFEPLTINNLIRYKLLSTIDNSTQITPTSLNNIKCPVYVKYKNDSGVINKTFTGEIVDKTLKDTTEDLIIYHYAGVYIEFGIITSKRQYYIEHPDEEIALIDISYQVFEIEQIGSNICPINTAYTSYADPDKINLTIIDINKKDYYNFIEYNLNDEELYYKLPKYKIKAYKYDDYVITPYAVVYTLTPLIVNADNPELPILDNPSVYGYSNASINNRLPEFEVSFIPKDVNDKRFDLLYYIRISAIDTSNSSIIDSDYAVMLHNSAKYIFTITHDINSTSDNLLPTNNTYYEQFINEMSKSNYIMTLPYAYDSRNKCKWSFTNYNITDKNSKSYLLDVSPNNTTDNNVYTLISSNSEAFHMRILITGHSFDMLTLKNQNWCLTLQSAWNKSYISNNDLKEIIIPFNKFTQFDSYTKELTGYQYCNDTNNARLYNYADKITSLLNIKANSKLWTYSQTILQPFYDYSVTIILHVDYICTANLTTDII